MNSKSQFFLPENFISIPRCYSYKNKKDFWMSMQEIRSTYVFKRLSSEYFFISHQTFSTIEYYGYYHKNIRNQMILKRKCVVFHDNPPIKIRNKVQFVLYLKAIFKLWIKSKTNPASGSRNKILDFFSAFDVSINSICQVSLGFP